MNLTQEERKVIVFLLIVALIGIGADFLSKQLIPRKSLAGFSEDLGKIDLNNADKKLLMSISGIGEKIAQRIIDHRDKERFNSIEELRNIKGVTKTRFERIKDYLIVQ